MNAVMHTKPPVDPTGGWEIEEALDIEYAHSMAPNAKIYLVEANSPYYSDLIPAVQVASKSVETSGRSSRSLNASSQLIDS